VALARRVSMTIKDWPEGERPREKLLKQGAQSLSDAELLAIFLRTGMSGKTAVDLARELLTRFGTLSALFAAAEQEFCAQPGLGPAKYVQLQAVLELARRSLNETLGASNVLDSPNTVRDYLRLTLRARVQEVFYCVFLDARHRVIAGEELFRGTLTQTSVYPREVVRRALQHNAAALILAHNHPSGAAEASHADRVLTRTLTEALKLVDVKVLDHFIVAQGQIVSFAERGWL
jgi:DNA repair protein RadC